MCICLLWCSYPPFVRPTNKNYTYCGLMTDLGLTEESEK